MLVKKLAVFVLALLVAAPAWSEDQRTFASAYDLSTPTEAADNDQIIASTNLLNNTTYSTLTDQPDVPRNITITVTDTTPSIVAGTITVNGLDVNGTAITEVLNLAGPTLTFTGTKVFASVTTVVTASVTVLGGAADETFIVGTGSVVGFIFCATVDTTRTCGTSDSSGWINASNLSGKSVYVDVRALTATGGVDYSVQCRGFGTNTLPYQVLNGNLSAARVPGVPNPLSTVVQLIPEKCPSVRVGLRFGTNDSAGTDSVDAYIVAVQ